MEKRVILFLLISLGIIFGYDYLLQKLGLFPSPNHPQSTLSQHSTPEEKPATADINTSIQEITSLHPKQVQEQLQEIETPLYHIILTNRGGAIQSWKLKKYLSQDPESPEPIELVYQEGAFPKPLTLQTSDPTITSLLQTSLYTVDRDFTTLDASHPIGHITYTYQNSEASFNVKKIFTFHYDKYVVDVQVKLSGLRQPLQVLLGTNFGIVEWGQRFIGVLGPAWKIGEQIEKEIPDPEIRRVGSIEWAALQDKYFIGALIPQDRATAVFARQEIDQVVTVGVEFPTEEGSYTEVSFHLYAGPKQFDLLKSFGKGLEDTIDFGWFIYGSWSIVKAIAKPLFYILRFLYEYTHNYGIAIILLTCGIKLLFVPLQYKSYKSMQGMQKIQPKVVELQNKYKDDRERLNRELIKLYREHKVNPVGGCLPMLLQMPVFVALFNILYMTIDLRQAPFMLWITDLSSPDPYYILPILMGASMVLQQKIMPTTMDPTQAKMMLLLPVFLTFLFLTFPSGLVLYWLTNNVLTITQQFITDRYILKKSREDHADREKADSTLLPETSAPTRKRKTKHLQQGEKGEKASDNTEQTPIQP
ncbi:MAG: membrane protein insertase YidC [Nitrospirae bacterium]|nr:MAG: membrane protein insertase YidC [Nitrospirota bacterium]